MVHDGVGLSHRGGLAHALQGAVQRDRVLVQQQCRQRPVDQRPRHERGHAGVAGRRDGLGGQLQRPVGVAQDVGRLAAPDLRPRVVQPARQPHGPAQRGQRALVLARERGGQALQVVEHQLPHGRVVGLAQGQGVLGDRGVLGLVARDAAGLRGEDQRGHGEGAVGVEQAVRGLAQAADRRAGDGVAQLDTAAHEVGQAVQLAGVREGAGLPQGFARAARLAVGPVVGRGGDQVRGLGGRCAGQGSGPLEGLRGRRVVPCPPGDRRGLAQLGGALVGRLAGHGGAVPDPPRPVRLRVEHPGEQGVGLAAFGDRRLGEQGRPRQRGGQPHVLALQHKQSGRARLLQRLQLQAGAHDGVELQVLVCHRDPHQPARVRRQRRQSGAQPGAQGAVGRQHARRGRARQLHDGQRVAARQVEHLLGVVLRDAQRAVRGQHAHRRRVVQRPQHRGRHALQRVLAARGLTAEQHRHRALGHPAGDEGKRLQRLGVQQSGVVDHDQQRAFAGDLDQEPVQLRVQPERAARGAGGQTGHRGERGGDAVGERLQQPVQARVRQRRLSRRAVRGEHAQTGGRGVGQPEQRGLAGTGSTHHDQRGTPTGASACEQVQHGGALLVPSVQHDLGSHVHSVARRLRTGEGVGPEFTYQR